MGIPTLDHLPGYTVLMQGKKYGPEPSCTKQDLEPASQAIRSSVVRQPPPQLFIVVENGCFVQSPVLLMVILTIC